MTTTTAVPEKFKNVDHLAWMIVGAIFIANGIYISEDENDLLYAALTAELTRRLAQMRKGRKPPTQKEQLAAAAILRGYGCWMYPYDSNPIALEVFTDTGDAWRRAHISSSIARRPYPGKVAAQAVVRTKFRGPGPHEIAAGQEAEPARKSRRKKTKES